jgi:hypothetical protein
MSAGLRRFTSGSSATPPPEPEPVAERCEMCGAEVVAEHGHLVDVEHRSLLCACRPCYLLFTQPAAGGGRYRAVPDRYLCDPEHPLTTVEWESLGIPVGATFFLRGDGDDAGTAAFYPSPAGATECLLDLGAWAALTTEHPLLAAAQPDVEAILIHSTRDEVEYFLVPIDACYQLVGTVRLYWKGFDGGQEARERIDELFGELRSRALPLRREA